jgi:hypothetical protein
MFLRSLLPRFSIRQLLVWTAFIGFACVSLRNASETWVAIAFAVVIMALGTTPMLVILRQGQVRAYWMGFAIIGGLYLGLLMYSFALEPNTANSNPLSASNLATARLASRCHSAIYGQEARANQLIFTTGLPATTYNVNLDGQALFSLDQNTGAGVVGTSSGSMLRTASLRLTMPVAVLSTGPRETDFVNVAHALWTLLLAACGGRFAQWLYQSRSKVEQSSSAANVRG